MFIREKIKSLILRSLLREQLTNLYFAQGLGKNSMQNKIKLYNVLIHCQCCALDTKNITTNNMCCSYNAKAQSLEES